MSATVSVHLTVYRCKCHWNDFQNVQIQGLKIWTYELLDPISTLEGRTARVHRSITVRGSERGERETDRDGAQYE